MTTFLASNWQGSLNIEFSSKKRFVNINSKTESKAIKLFTQTQTDGNNMCGWERIVSNLNNYSYILTFSSLTLLYQAFYRLS